jgi:hypothetical protein
MYLLAKVPLAGVLLCELLPVAEEMVLVASGLLERKEKIPLGLETLGEEKVLLSSGALLVIWCSWNLSFSLDWTGGHRHLCFWSLPMRRYAVTTMEIREYKCNRCKNGIGMDGRV